MSIWLLMEPKAFGRKSPLKKNRLDLERGSNKETIYRALGDCSATKYAPTAQVASQEGAFLARLFNSLAKTQAIEEELAKLDHQLQNTESEAEKTGLTTEINLKGRSLSKIKQIS